MRHYCPTCGVEEGEHHKPDCSFMIEQRTLFFTPKQPPMCCNCHWYYERQQNYPGGLTSVHGECQYNPPGEKGFPPTRPDAKCHEFKEAK